jgi:hypothetical protein
MAQIKHAAIRAQQRGIPPLVDRWLNEFGEEDHDGEGAVRLYFSHRSIQEMERVLGRQPVCIFKRYLQTYKIESCADGTTITVGHRTCRLWRK